MRKRPAKQIEGKLIGDGKSIPVSFTATEVTLPGDGGTSTLAHFSLAAPSECPDGVYMLEYFYNGLQRNNVRIKDGDLSQY